MDQGQEEFTNRSIYSNDLYAFNLITEKWAQIISTSSLPESSESGKVSPSGRRSHSAIVYKDKIIIFGGFRQSDNPTHFNDLYEFDSGNLNLNLIFLH
jgi:N-acetylneuraminic acid mutarotase